MNSSAPDTPVGQRLADLRAGATASLVALPVAIGGGLLVTAPLGPGYASLGVAAGLLSAILAAIATPLCNSSRFTIGGPSAATSIVLAGALAHLLHSRLISPAQLPLVMMLITGLAGLTLVIAGLLRWGNLIKFIPRPVLAGFVNGIALLLFLSQLPSALGEEGGLSLSAIVTGRWHWGAGLVAAVTVWVSLRAIAWRLPLQPQFAGLLAGLGMHYLLDFLAADRHLGAVVGPLPALLQVPAWLDQWQEPALAGLPWGQMLAATALLTLMGAIQTLMTAIAVDNQANTRHDASRELIGFGVGNVVAALGGGVPSSGNLGRAVANYRAGARSRLAGLFNGVVMAGLVVAGATLIAWIPLAVMAGLLIHSAIVMVDRWSLREIGRALRQPEGGEARGNVLVILIMTFGMLWTNPAVDVAIGVVLSTLLFLRRMSGTLVRRHYDCRATRSLRVRPPAHEPILRRAGQDWHVIELEGALFFGTADRLRELVEQAHGAARVVILDGRHVTEADSTGLQILGQLHRSLREAGRELLLAHFSERGGHLPMAELERYLPASQRFADLDRALEYLENRCLADQAPTADPSLVFASVADTSLAAGLDEDERACLASHFETFRLAAGETLFEAGAPGHSLFVLLEGEILLGLPLPGRLELLRLLSLSPGVLFGEMALLDGQPRSASAVATTDVVLQAMRREHLEALQVAQPAIYAKFMHNIAREMSHRLRLANQQLRALEP